MAANSLTAALLGGQGGNEAAMYGMDPAVAAATPDLQLGQALIQGGLSTAPASPWQALARVAQAGTGAYLKQGAISDLAKAYSGSSEHMAQVFDQVSKNPNNIVSQLLRSPDPLVRMQGMQMAQKAGLQLNEPQDVRPGNQVVQPGAPGPAATNTNARSPVGITAEDAQRAVTTNPAAVVPLGRDITKATSMEGGYQPPPTGIPGQPAPPSGPPRLTAPLTPTAAVPPPAPNAGGSILPHGAQIVGLGAPPPSASIPNAPQPPAPQASTYNQQAQLLPGYAANQATVAGAKAGAEENAKNEANLQGLLKPPGPLQPGPGTTEPIKTASGTTIPPVSAQGQLPTNPAQLKEAIPAWQKKETDWNASLQPAQQAEQRLQTIANTFKAIETGSFTSHKADFAAALKAVGIDPAHFNLDDPAKVQLALHENYVETLQQLKATTSRFTQMEFRVLSENKEHPDLQPSANLQMLGEDIGALRQARDLPSDFIAAKGNGWQNPQSFESAWLKANPLSGYVDKVKGEIGPLKGMPATKSSPAGGGVVHWERGPDGVPRQVQ